MLDLKRMGTGRQLLQQVLIQHVSKEKQWAKHQKERTQQSQKNCSPSKHT